MNDDIAEIIFSEEQIQKKVRELAGKISNDYRNKQLTIVSVLKGGIPFLSDLLKHIDIPLSIDFIAAASYKNTESSGIVRFIMDLREPAENKNLLIVEDIVDTGRTLDYICKNLKTRKPKSLKICALLDKSSRRIKNIKIDYFGFEIPDKFVVGYGMDYNELYRNLPYIGILKSKVFRQKKGVNCS
ncbi:MAG: hypoxanthine phosphoribosyltransferase [Elusimicrobia bacterium]|nr:hypoxanthine phosphoribosyltransferase [Elusimicrobiota bacterium]